MNPLIVVGLCGIVAALVSFAVSASRTLTIDPVDPALEERAFRRWIRRHPKFARFLGERMDRRTAGGFLLSMSIVVVFVVSVIVGALLDLIGDGSWLGHIDRSVAEWGSRHQTSSVVSGLKWVTQLGSTVVISAILVIVAGVGYIKRRRTDVVLFVLAVGVGQLALANLLKVTVHRARPAVLHLVAASGYSFPSGHAVAAAAAWSAVALVLGFGHSRRTRAVLAGAAALIAVSVAASRALLGVHWISDVVAGLVIGWGWFTIVAVLFDGRAQRLGAAVVETAGPVTPAVVPQADSTPAASAG